MALNDIAEQSFDFLSRGLTPDAVARAQQLTGDDVGEAAEQMPFSQFNPVQAREAQGFLADLEGILSDMPDEQGVRLAWRRAQEEALRGRAAMVQEVWATFVTHASTRLPELAQLKVPPVAFVDEADEAHAFDVSLREPAAAPAPPPESAAVVEGDEERPLDWFREDLFFTEHHRWWHVVYPSFRLSGLDRHGELFIYMHQQMLARYDTERLAAGMPRLQPRDDMTAAVRWGYDPDARAPTVAGYSARDGDQAPNGENLDYALELNARIERLRSVVEDGAFPPGGPQLDINTLGGVLEGNAGFRDAAWAQDLVDIHNWGHGVLADLSPPVEVNGRVNTGIMGIPAYAPQDHVFWEWHKQVDNVAEAWRTREGPQALQALPELEIRSQSAAGGDELSSPDILFVTFDSLLEAGIDPMSATAAELDAFANQRFGGEQWDRAFASGEEGATGELGTYMIEGRFNVPDQDQNLPFTRQHLNHDRFATIVRVGNGSDEEVAATIRLFLVAEALLDDRRMWIEMDRIPLLLPRRSRRVVARLGDRASVVRKSRGRAPWPYPFGTFEQHRAQQTVPITSGRAPDEYCECGWPYSLYLPRGTGEGMKFVMAAMVTRDDALDLERSGECGSRSFCGKRDPVYPDGKPMGYPFNRDWEVPGMGPVSIREGLQSVPNLAARRLTIRHDGSQRLRARE